MQTTHTHTQKVNGFSLKASTQIFETHKKKKKSTSHFTLVMGPDLEK
jgi:hypothetical protein